MTIQRVAVVGATGFTGEHVMRRLAAAGIQATAVVRATSDRRTVRELTDRFAVADMECAEQMEAALRGHDAMIHVASMGFRDAPAYVDAVERAGVQRAVFTSTTSILTRLPVRSKPIRAAAEHAVQGSAIDWTIIRPTMIYGTDRDRNICRLLKFLKRWRCMVLPGGGRALQQPVHVDDVADAAVSALFETRASRRTYNLSGEHSLTFRALVETAARSIGVRPWTLHAPVDGLATAVGVLERARFPLRLRAEQILRIAEDKAFDHEDASRDFGFRPRSFEEGVGQEAQLLGLASKARA